MPLFNAMLIFLPNDATPSTYSLMLLPPAGLFSDSLLLDLDLHRLQEYYSKNIQQFRIFIFNAVVDTNSFIFTSTATSPAAGVQLMSIVREPELLEQDLRPFPAASSASIASLPPGKLPGLAAPTASLLPSLFSEQVTLGIKQPAAATGAPFESPSKKRSKTEHITIEHF
jgi:hypothetical protein